MRHINRLIALMSLSLFGIAGVQAYWVVQTLRAKEQQFGERVSGCLQDVAMRMEARENINLLMNNFRIEPIFPDPLKKVIANGKMDSLLQLSTNGQANLNDLRISLQLNDDSVLMSDQGRFEWESTFSERGEDFSKEGKVVVTAKLQEDGIRITRKLYQLDSIFQKLVMQGFHKGVPLEQRLDAEDLDSVISFEFESKGLPADYEYGVMEGNDLSSIHSAAFRPDEADFQVPLFKNDVYGHPKLLMITFPNKTRYLLGNMWSTLILALLFTLAILVVFWITVRLMLRQKRISDIKTDFINNMTHEFKTPIATISLAVDAMGNQKVQQDPSRLGHYADIIRQENKRMNAQVEHVLRMALLDKRELELRKELIDIHPLIDEAAEHLRLQVESREGTLEIFPEATRSTVLADAEHLRNVLVNILDNANKYSLEAPRITVRTYNEGQEVVVAVSDKGIGMSREVQKRIFERFYRESRGNIHEIKGHGLGLSYVQEMVKAHQGRIEVESTPGQGSTFFIHIPLTT